MALQTAADARIASDATVIQDNPALDSKAINRMNNNIITASTDTNTDERIYSVTVRYSADLHDGVEAAEIIQADLTRVFLRDVRTVLVDAGYRVSVNRLPNPSGDHVKITVAW